MIYEESDRGTSNVSEAEFAQKVLFLCDDLEVCERIQTENWKKAKLSYEIFQQLDEMIASFNREIPDAIVFIAHDARPLSWSDDYNEFFTQCKWLNIAVFCSVKEYEQRLIRSIARFDDLLLFPFTVEELLVRLDLYEHKLTASYQVAKQEVENELYEFSFLPLIYQLFMATLTRLKKPFTLLFLSFTSFEQTRAEINEDIVRRMFMMRMNEVMLRHVRHSDFVFKMNRSGDLIILFPYSGEVEVNHFLKRIEKQLQPLLFSFNGEQVEIIPRLIGSIVEIQDERASFEDVIEAGKASLARETSATSELAIEVVSAFRSPNTELVKVSIIEADAILANIIENVLKNIEVENIEFELATYVDGNQFFEAGRHLTAHTHLIIVDDILPKKDGFEVVHELRELPNTNKYLLFMLSTKKTDEDMTYAFHIGVDEYLIKPFNPKMFEAKIKRALSRFR